MFMCLSTVLQELIHSLKDQSWTILTTTEKEINTAIFAKAKGKDGSITNRLFVQYKFFTLALEENRKTRTFSIYLLLNVFYLTTNLPL